MTKRGKLIVICGTDGSGKGTQTNLLVKNLKQHNIPVETIDFPQYGKKSAGLVEEYLNGKYGGANEVCPKVASIFYAADRYDASFTIRKWLEQGKNVICNRYTSANMGHQAGKIKDKEQRDQFLDWLNDLEFNIFRIPKPDINILLYMPSAVGQKLVDKKGHRDYVGGEKRDIHEADLQHLKDAEEAYAYVAKKYNWERIDCNEGDEPLPIEKIQKMVLDKVNNIIE